MEFTVNVKLDASPALTGCINALASALGGAQPQVINNAAPAKKKKAEEVKQESAPVEESPKAEKVKEESAPVEEQPKAEEVKEITDEELRAIVGPKTKEFGKDAVFGILAEMGVKRVPDLTQEQRVVFLERLRAL